jgi:hypothetical protein
VCLVIDRTALTETYGFFFLF